jgi:hypothetical protein
MNLYFRLSLLENHFNVLNEGDAMEAMDLLKPKNARKYSIGGLVLGGLL